METQTFVLFQSEKTNEKKNLAVFTISCAQTVLTDAGLSCFATDGKMCAKIVLENGAKIRLAGV